MTRRGPDAFPNPQPTHRVARRGLRFTREGRLFVLVTLGVGAAAVNTGNNLLYLLLGLMLSLILLSGVLSEGVLAGVRVRRSLPARAFARSPCLIELWLINEKRWLPSFSIEVEEQAEGEPTDRRCYFLKVAPRSQEVAVYRRTPSRRGRLVLARFRLSTRYPFGFFEKWRIIEDRAELLVYPALLPVEFPGVPVGGGRQERSAPRPGRGTEVAGLREHRDGDDARAVHWVRSAALGRLVVRERERETGARLVIVLDEAKPIDASDRWDEAFEDAISRAASIADRALRNGVAVEVVTRTGASPWVLPGTPPDPIFQFLARLEAIDADGAPPLPVRRGFRDERVATLIPAPGTAREAPPPLEAG
jgi:uncharacterized protein (DUF58 family)